MLQQFQRRAEVWQAVGAEVQVAQGGGQMTVAEQALQRGQIGAGFEQVGGVAVPQRVTGRSLPQSGGLTGPVKAALQNRHVQRSAARTGEPIGEIANRKAAEQNAAPPIGPLRNRASA